MGLTFSVVTTPADRVAAELLAVPVAKGGVLAAGAESVDAALGGGLEAFLDEAGFEGNLGETLAVPTSGRLHAKAAVLVGETLLGGGQPVQGGGHQQEGPGVLGACGEKGGGDSGSAGSAGNQAIRSGSAGVPATVGVGVSASVVGVLVGVGVGMRVAARVARSSPNFL